MTRAAPRGHRTGLGLALALVLAAACSSASSSPAPSPPPGPTPPAPAREVVAARPGTPALLGSLAALVGQLPDPAQLAAWAKKIDAGEAPLGDYLDELLRTERFAAEVVPALVFGMFVNVRNYYAVPSAFVLKRAAEPGAPLYLDAPCAAAEATLVQPWWNLASEVRVCPDAYRPYKWTLEPGEHSYKTSVVLSCDSQIGSPELEGSSPCGCGPNLIRCLRDEDQYNELNRSLMDEVRRTTAYVVEHDLPMAALFTSNSTFRDRNVELYYRRQKIGALQMKSPEKELASLGAWPVSGKWAPRAEIRPGQHAGLLTAPQILHWLPDRRQRQRGYYEIMWCNLRNSFGATTHKVLELNANGNNFFVHDSWKKLAHTELCTSCHARLDYGSQFFQGYLDSRASTHFHPALQTTERGPLYGQDINDLRGEAPLTPLGFAKLATDQPDFKQCMTNHLVSYVLGGRATGDDVRAIDAAVEQSRTFRASMKVALERYATRWRDGAGAPTSAPDVSGQAAAAPPGPGAPGGVTVGPALRAQLDRHCVDCHDSAPYADTADSDDLPFALTGGVLPRSLVVSMTDQVAFGMMPKDQALDPALREDLVGLLIDALWTDPAARAEARRYYLGRARGLPAQQIDNALHAISQIARSSSDIAWGAFERGIWSDQSSITPGFLAVTGLDAVSACARGQETEDDAELEDCLRRALSLNILSRWPP